MIPGSDGAGEVVAVGRQVQRFKPGDKVVTLFNQGHIGGDITREAAATGLGGAVDGVLRTYGAFNENGLVALPRGYSYLEGSTLPCAALTAWNALYGLEGKRLTPGQWVLTQGTGGVSVWAVQFAKAAGARVIATTSSAAKAKLLEKLGADHIVNYNETPEWGSEVRKITGGEGVDIVIEVAGPTSMIQSLKSVKVGGVITIIGFVGGTQSEKQPGFLENLNRLCITRGLLVGSRDQFDEMNRAIEANLEKLRPVIDEKVFTLETLREAYEYQWSGKHQGKVCVEIS